MLGRGVRKVVVQIKQMNGWIKMITNGTIQTPLQIADSEELPKSRKQVSRDITKCNYVSDFQYVFEREKGNLTAVHMSVALTKLSKVLANMDSSRIQRGKSQSTQSSQDQGLELICFLCSGLNEKMEELSTQSVANSLWALTNLFQSIKIIEPQKKSIIQQTFEKLVDRAGKISDAMNAHDVTNVIWSLARNKQIFQNLSQQNNDSNFVLRNLMDRCLNIDQKDFRPQAIANIMWGISYMDQKNSKIAKRFIQISKNQLDDFKLQEIAMFLWSLQKMRWKDPEFLSLIEQMILKYGTSEIQSPVDVGSLVMSFAEFRFHSRPALEILINQFIKLIFEQKQTQQYRFQDHFRTGANLIYALSVLNAPISYAEQVLEIITKNYSKNIENINASQIYLASLFFDAQCENLQIDPQIKKLGQQEWRKHVFQSINSKKSSLFQEIVEQLEELKIRFQIGQFALDGDAEIQIQLLNLGREKVALRPLEINCYTSNPERELLGTVEAHIELLQAHGWSVIMVPFFEWNQYRTKNGRANYLARRIEKVM